MATKKTDNWKRLVGWLESNLPEVVADLKPGASDDSIDRWQKKMKCELPADLRALYRLHDGQKGNATGPFYGLELMSLSAAHDAWKLAYDALQEDPDGMRELAENCSTHPEGCIKPDFMNPGWIPFAHDHGGNFLGIDLDPDVAGTRGQVINMGRDEDEKYVLAPSFDAFLGWLVAELEGGNVVIAEEDDGGHSFNTKTPKTQHFFSSVPKLFGRTSRTKRT